MGLNLLIRPASQEDLPETTRIYMECIRADYAFKPQKLHDSLNEEDELAECEHWLYKSDHPNQIFVAMDGHYMAGYIAVGPNVGRPYNKDGEICGFFVRKTYRRQGVGLRLLKAGCLYLKSLGYRKVVLFNYRISEANGFYRRLGGQVVHQEIQSPGGMPLETDVFCYEIQALLSTLDQRLAQYSDQK